MLGAFARRHVLIAATLRAFVDVSSLALAYGAAIAMTRGVDEGAGDYAASHVIYLAAIALTWCVIAVDQRLFITSGNESMVGMLFAITRAFFVTLLISIFFLALFLDAPNRGLIVAFSMWGLTSLLIVRLGFGLTLWNLRRRGYSTRRILIVGANARTEHLVEVLRAHEQFGFVVEGFLEDEMARRERLEKLEVPYLGPIQELESLLLNRVIDAVYIGLPIRSFYERILSITHLCEGIGVPVRFVADLFPVRMVQSMFERLDASPVIALTFQREFKARFALNRLIDVAIALLLIGILSPVFLLVALAIKATSKGPILSLRKQLRGDAGSYNLVSFRVQESHDPRSPVSETDTPRLSTAGRFLRRYGIEELPYLYNVLMGHLSLSGPLPTLGYAVSGEKNGTLNAG